MPGQSALVGSFSLPRTENPRVGGSIPSLAICFMSLALLPEVFLAPSPGQHTTRSYGAVATGGASSRGEADAAARTMLRSIPANTI